MNVDEEKYLRKNIVNDDKYLVKSHHRLQIMECPVAKGVVNTFITAAIDED